MGRFRFPGPRPPPPRSVMDRIHDAPDTPAITRSSGRKETSASGFFITAVALGRVRVFPIRNGLCGIRPYGSGKHATLKIADRRLATCPRLQHLCRRAGRAPGAFVFKTLNTTGAGNMAKAADYPVKPVMLVAGDDAGRKPGVMELVGKLGFEPVDAGPLKNARLLEPFAMVWIDQAMKRGRGRDFAFALVNMR